MSEAMTRLCEQEAGRPPTTVKTYWVTEDLITMTLDDTVTPEERAASEMGADQELRTHPRMFPHDAILREFCAVVEEISGRKVHTFVSSHKAIRDGHYVKMFSLHPEGYDGPSETVHARF